MPADKTWTSASVTSSYTSVQTAGDLNVVVLGWHDISAAPSAVTDKLGNTYTLAIGPTRGTNLSQSIYYAQNIKAGANIVTAKFSTNASSPVLTVLEYSGATTVPAYALIVAAGITNAKYTGAHAPYIKRLITNPNKTALAEDLWVTTAGSYNATANLSTTSSYYVMQMAVFNPVLAPSPTPTPTPSPTPTPTPSPSATLGYNVQGANVGSTESNDITAGRYQMPNQDGTVTSMSVFVASPVSASPNNLFQVAIYADASGVPGALIAKSASQTIVPDAWTTVAISASLSANTYYWRTRGATFSKTASCFARNRVALTHQSVEFGCEAQIRAQIYFPHQNPARLRKS